MNFLFIKTLWANIELSLIKVCATAFGIILGIYFDEFLKSYLILIWIIFIVTAIWGIILWTKKISATDKAKPW